MEEKREEKEKINSPLKTKFTRKFFYWDWHFYLSPIYF